MAPTGSCLFGDSVVYNYETNSVMNCEEALDHFSVVKKKSFKQLCLNYEHGTLANECCSTCKSKSCRIPVIKLSKFQVS